MLWGTHLKTTTKKMMAVLVGVVDDGDEDSPFQAAILPYPVSKAKD